jgi:hypothetical protein
LYKVISYFEDLQDNSRPYNVGDTFPAEGVEVMQERFAELASNKNRQGKPLIKEVKLPKKSVKKADKE